MTPGAINGGIVREAQGQWVTVVAINPQSVCCEESLLVCAMRCVGVELHPLMPFSILVDEVEGKTRTRWRWRLAAKSKDGLYKTSDLQKWWSDASWLAANRTHEFAVLRAGLWSMGVQAGEIRARVPRVLVMCGQDEAHIPVNASPARREWLIARLERRIPMNTPFVEPVLGDRESEIAERERAHPFGEGEAE